MKSGAFSVKGKTDVYSVRDCINITPSSRTHSCISDSTKEIYRMKIIPKYNVDRTISKQDLDDELKIVQEIKHSTINTLIDFFEDDSNYYLISSFFSNDTLLNIINGPTKIGEQRLRNIMGQLVDCIACLHSVYKVALRCLRPENILVDSHDKVVLSDFTHATFCGPSEMLDDFFGSTAYSPPEMLLHENYNGYLVDIWSLGVIFYQLICRQIPWHCTNDTDLGYEMRDLLLTKNAGMSISEFNLLTKMLDPNQTRRYSINQIQSHFWMQNAKTGERNHLYTLMKSNTISLPLTKGGLKPFSLSDDKPSTDVTPTFMNDEENGEAPKTSINVHSVSKVQRIRTNSLIVDKRQANLCSLPPNKMGMLPPKKHTIMRNIPLKKIILCEK